MILPTKNQLTDKFGVYRSWGAGGWTPKSAYSPIHAGVDFSARGERIIHMPVSGRYESMSVGGHIGTVIKIKPDDSQDILMYLFHCELCGNGHAVEGQVLTQHQPMPKREGFGTGAPHLHFEVAVNKRIIESFQLDLPDQHLGAYIIEKAELEDLNKTQVLHRVQEQIEAWWIIEVRKTFIHRARQAFGSWRKMKGSKLGQEDFYMLDPFVLAGAEYER